MQAKIWPRDDEERQDLVKEGWGDRLDDVFFTRDLARGQGILFCATGISRSPLLAGITVRGSTAITHSIILRVKMGTVRFVQAHHNLNRKTMRLRSANREVRLS